MADRIVTQISRQPGAVYDISSGPNANSIPGEPSPLVHNRGPQIPPPARACQKLRGENVPCFSLSQEKDLPALPQPVQYYESASSVHQSALLNRGYGSSLGAGRERIARSMQSYSRESRSVQFIVEAKMATFWKAIISLFRRILSQYGERHEDSAPAQITNGLIESYPHGMRLFLILLSGALPYVVVVLDDTVVAIIIPRLISDFQKPEDIGWYASAYFLPLTVLMPLYGKCYSLWRVKWLFIFALATIIVGSILSAAAHTTFEFIIGRAIAGAGAAGIITGAMRIIALVAPRKHRTFLEAAGAVVMGVSTVSGPILGGAIADTIGWQWAFWINVPIACISVSIIFLFFPKELSSSSLLKLPFREKLRRLDLIGASLLITGLVCLSCALQSISISTHLSGSEITLLTFAAALLATFLFHARYISSEVSLTPRGILSVRAIWSCCLGLFFLFAGFINFIFFLSIFFQSVQGQSAQGSAISLLPYVLSVSTGAVITGLAVSKLRYYNPFFICGGILFATGAALIHTFDITTSLKVRIAYEAILGLGAGFLMLANVASCQISLEEKHHSVAQGLTFFCSLLGSTISLPVSSTIFNRILRYQVEPLDIPLLLKELVLSDPTKAQSVVPAEYRQIILEVLVYSIRKAFLLGIVCSILCALSFYLVPWLPLISSPEAQQGGPTNPLDLPPEPPLISLTHNPVALNCP